MMNSNATPKIVIGIGLAAVFGVGVSIFAVRAKHESEIARNTPAPIAAPAEQSVGDSSAQTPSDATTSAPTASSAAPPAAVVPAPVAPIAPAASPAADSSRTAGSNAADRSDRHVARVRGSVDTTAGTRIASVAGEPTASAPAAASVDVQPMTQQAGQETAGSDAAAPSDSQITASVKSEIATAAPSGNVDVTTTNGAVALAGSVPSQDAADQARRAAQRVAGVKQVDASALTVSNQ